MKQVLILESIGIDGEIDDRSIDTAGLDLPRFDPFLDSDDGDPLELSELVPFATGGLGVSLPPLLDRTNAAWCLQSDSTNARMERLLLGLRPRKWWEFWKQ